MGRFWDTVYVQVAHTHTHPFNGPFSGTTRVSRYQKGKTNPDCTEARDSEWQWHQLGRMQVCISLQTDNHASTRPLKVFTGRMPFLPSNQQRQKALEDFVGAKFYCSLLKAASTCGLGRIHSSSPQQCYLHSICTFTIRLKCTIIPL